MSTVPVQSPKRQNPSPLQPTQREESIYVLKWTRSFSVTRLLLLSAALIIQILPRCSYSQQPGIPLFSTQAGSQYESVNLANGNINLHLPLRSKSGPVPLSIQFVGGDDLGWINDGSSYTPWQLIDQPGTTLALGTAVENVTLNNPTYQPCSASGWIADWTLWGVNDESGAFHPVGTGLAGERYQYNECDGSYTIFNGSTFVPLTVGSSFLTNDGSGYTVLFTNGTSDIFTVYNRSGNYGSLYEQGSNRSVTSPNGATVTAQVSGSPLVVIDPYEQPNGQPVLTWTSTPVSAFSNWSYIDGSGTTQNITFGNSSLTQVTNFGCTAQGIQDISNPPESFLTSINLPNGRSYTFSYEQTPGNPSDITGRLAKIGLPTGGNITYAYSGSSNGVYCDAPDGDPVINYGALPPVLTRTVDDGNGHSSTWTYSFSDPTYTSNGYLSSTTVTDPLGNVTNYQFVNGVQTEEQVYQGLGQTTTLLKSVVTCYNGNFTNCPTPPQIPPSYTGESVTQTDVFTAFNSSNSYSLEESVLNAYGLPTDVKEFDFGTVALGSAPSGSPLKETITSYGSWNSGDQTCHPINTLLGSGTISSIEDHPCEVIVKSPGTVVSDIRNTYDSRGNTTAISSWVSGSNWVSQSFVYDGSNGVLTLATDANGNTTGYSGFVCNGLLPTKITQTSADNSKSMTTGESWDCNSGLLTSSIGPALGSNYNSSNTTTYAYSDPFFRPTQTNYPDGGQTTTCYSDVGGSQCTQSSTANTVTTSRTATPSPTQTSVVVQDGLGRPIYQVASGGIYTAYGYDSAGHMCAQSNPSASVAPSAGLSCNPSETPASTSTTDGTKYSYFDALDRPTLVTEQDGTTQSWSYSGNTSIFSDENGNQWEGVTDALGRLTKVMEPNGSGASPTLETDYVYDSLNNLLSVKQWGGGYGSPGTNGPVQRSFSYDGLSRLIAAFNPENASPSNPAAQTCPGASGGSWTNCYGYDPNGNLTSKVDNRSVTTTLQYDWLNRLVSKIYTGITAFSSCYQYDTGNAGPGSGAGLLGAEWTLNGPCATTGPPPLPATAYGSLRIFDGYDLMGRLVMERQCAGGYCTSTSIPSVPSVNCTSLTGGNGLQACYDYAGNKLAFSNGVTTTAAGSYSQYAMAFSQSFDSAGRPLSVTSTWNDSTHPSTLFSGPEYTPFNSLLTWTLGQHLVVSRDFDNRMRVTDQSAAQK